MGKVWHTLTLALRITRLKANVPHFSAHPYSTTTFLLETSTPSIETETR